MATSKASQAALCSLEAVLCSTAKEGHIVKIDEIRAKLADRRLDIISDETGIHRSTIARIRDGKTVPTYYVMQKLSAYFEANP